MGEYDLCVNTNHTDRQTDTHIKTMTQHGLGPQQGSNLGGQEGRGSASEEEMPQKKMKQPNILVNLYI